MSRGVGGISVYFEWRWPHVEMQLYAIHYQYRHSLFQSLGGTVVLVSVGVTDGLIGKMRSSIELAG